MVISEFVSWLVSSVFYLARKFGLNKGRFQFIQVKHHLLRSLALKGALKCHRIDERSQAAFLSLAAKGWEAKKDD